MDKIEIIFVKKSDSKEIYAIFPYRITDRKGSMLAIKTQPFEKSYISFSYKQFINNTEKCHDKEIESGTERLKEMGYREFSIVKTINVKKYDKACEKLLIFNARKF